MTKVPCKAVIMAGGKGTRLAPYTVTFPKPLMPLGDMPVMELLIRQLRRQGIDDIILAVGHLAALIQSYFGDGSALGVTITYSTETEPLGTAGPLRLVQGLDETLLVMNGDLLTDLDFSALMGAHRAVESPATVGVYRRETTIDLGVIELSPAGGILRYVEKPVHDYLVSMGVYVLEPSVLDLIPPDRPFDLPDLINGLLARGTVNAYEHVGYWLDIGRPDDYSRAQDDFASMRARLLGEEPGARRPGSDTPRAKG